MNNIVYKHYDLYEDLQDFYEINKKKLDSHPDIKTYFKKINENRTQLNKYGVVKGENMNMYPEQYNILKAEMGLAIHANCNPAAKFYLAKGDLKIHEQLKFSKAGLITASYERLVRDAAIVKNAITPNLKELKSVGVTEASLKKIDEVETRFEAFMKSINYKSKWKMHITKVIHDLDKATLKFVKEDLKIAIYSYTSKDRKLISDFDYIVERKRT